MTEIIISLRAVDQVDAFSRHYAGALFSVTSSWAEDAIAEDGDTIQLAGVTYKLRMASDAPEFDQMLHRRSTPEPWACGVEARDRRSPSWIGKRAVQGCEDLGPAEPTPNGTSAFAPPI